MILPLPLPLNRLERPVRASSVNAQIRQVGAKVEHRLFLAAWWQPNAKLYILAGSSDNHGRILMVQCLNNDIAINSWVGRKVDSGLRRTLVIISKTRGGPNCPRKEKTDTAFSYPPNTLRTWF